MRRQIVVRAASGRARQAFRSKWRPLAPALRRSQGAVRTPFRRVGCLTRVGWQWSRHQGAAAAAEFLRRY